MTQDNTIVLRTYPDMAQASIVRDQLEAAGIAAFVNDENVLGMDPVGGAELKIFEKDREAAQQIIGSATQK